MLRLFNTCWDLWGVGASSRAASDRSLISRIRRHRLTYLSRAKMASVAAACHAIEDAALPGIFLEAGCGLGGSAILIALLKNKTRPLFLYDVFGMIPPPGDEDAADVHDRYRIIAEGKSKGIGGDTYYGYVADLQDAVTANLRHFGVGCEDHNVTLVKGLLQDTLHVHQSIAFAHIDVDWYEPVTTCLERIFPRLVPGGIMILDDYDSWSGCRKAVDRFLGRVGDQVTIDGAAGSMKITRRHDATSS